MVNEHARTKLFFYVRVYLFFLLLSCLLYINSFSNAFVFDDSVQVLGRSDVRNFSFSFFVQPYVFKNSKAGAYRPFVVESIAINWKMNQLYKMGDRPTVFRLTNVMLHGTVSFLVFLLLFRIFEQYVHVSRLSWLGSLLFLCHPLHTEVVNSIVNRSELLSAVFGLSALLVLLVRRWSVLLRVSLCCIFVLFALFSKESAVGIIPVLFFVWMYSHVLYQKRWVKYSLLLIVPLFFVFCLYGLMRWTALGGSFIGTDATYVENPLRFVSFAQRTATAFEIVGMYAQKMIAPYWISADYSCCQIPIIGWTHAVAWIGLGIYLFVLCGFVYAVVKRSIHLIIAYGLLLFPFFVVSNILFAIGTIMAERFMYLPLVGLIILGAVVAMRLCKRVSMPYFFVFVCFVMGSWWIRVLLRNADWKTAYSFYTSMTQTSPNSVLAHSNASAIYYLNGEIDKAWNEMRIAESIYPDYIHVPNNRGLLLQYDGKLIEAEQSFLRALQIQPIYENARINLLRVLFYQEKYDEILKWCDTWEGNAAGDGRDTFFFQALSYAALQREDEFTKALEKLKEMNHAVSYVQGFAAYVRNDYDQAQLYFGQAMNEQPVDVYLLFLYGDSFRSPGYSNRKMVVEQSLQKIGSPYALMLREKMMK